MTLLYDLQEVDGQVTVKCCYNGWTLEFSGINKEGEWVSTKNAVLYRRRSNEPTPGIRSS